MARVIGVDYGRRELTYEISGRYEGEVDAKNGDKNCH